MERAEVAGNQPAHQKEDTGKASVPEVVPEAIEDQLATRQKEDTGKASLLVKRQHHMTSNETDLPEELKDWEAVTLSTQL